MSQLAYLAGFFDGEGCVSITKNGSVDLRIVNTNKSVLEEFKDRFGGSVTSRKQRTNKNQYVWCIYGIEAVVASQLLFTHSRDKAEQLIAVIEYFDKRNTIQTITKENSKGRFGNPERKALVTKYRSLLSDLKKKEQ